MLQSEPLLVREGACENSSTVTATLVLSTIVAACISFGVGCVIGYKSPTQSEIMEDLSLSIAEAIQNAGYAYHFSYVGAFVSGKTADLLGRKGTMWVLNIFYIVGWLAIAFAKVSSAGLCVGSFLTGMSFLLQTFPINIKGAAGSLAGLTGNICSWTVSYNFNFLFQWSSTGTFFIFSAICGVCVIFIAKMIPETKGRTLEEIQAPLTTSP
ncbi:hypothetical protein V6Z11_A11G300100 [Gossypium hirsutum]